MPPAFDALALERSYSFLDDCPPALLAEVVTFPSGTLAERVVGVRVWSDALLAGRLPAPGRWPPPELDKPVRSALEELQLARFCKDQPELVEAVLKDILHSFRQQAELNQKEVAAQLQKLEELERARRSTKDHPQISLDEATLQRLRAQAEQVVREQARAADAKLLQSWGERARCWAEISEVFGDLGQMLGRGWDMARGVLKQSGWLDVLKLRKLVEQLPQLREIVRSLGRLQVSDHDEPVAETVFAPVQRLEEERLEIRTPHVPAETRGIERSGEIARMLPVEASLLGHAKLRMLWHARRAERALLTYRVEGVEIERRHVLTEDVGEQEKQRPRPERGPIVAVIDTSGSMHGLPETVAKAVVLEAMRVAHAEKRRCYLYAYSGPGQVVEQELDLSQKGLAQLMSFLGMSFGGGNDETGMMNRVVLRLQERDWKKADVVFVSDGEWPAPQSLISMVAQAREVGTRFHGVQIGNRGRTGLHALCEPVHVFTDWAALGGWR